jgi:hypothetical protein
MNDGHAQATIDAKQAGMLEKKWTSILRLQKKVSAMCRTLITR